MGGFLVPYLEQERAAGRLRPGVEVERAADFLARMLLSWISAPGAWDLEDPEQTADLARGGASSWPPFSARLSRDR